MPWNHLAAPLAALLGALSLAPTAVAAPSDAFAPPAPAYEPVPTPEQLADAAAHSFSTAVDPFFFDPADPFYLPPERLPADPGVVLRTQDAPHLLNVGGENLPGHASKILYTSTRADGTPTAVSGVVIEPAHTWPGDGPTPTIVFAPGTRGGGDACAPSRGPWLTGVVDPVGQSVGVNYEIPMYYAASLQGIRVVVTDYIGLGTPGPHTYVHHTEEAHAVLDAARAGLRAASAPTDSPLAFSGYSQGGGAAAAAAELAVEYAPELNVKGTYSGAPPADLPAVMTAVDGSLISGVLGYAMAGFSARDPEFAAALDGILSDEGRAFVDDNAAGCIGDSAVNWGMRPTNSLTASGASLSEAAFADPYLPDALSAQNLGQQGPTAPVMISGGDHDDVIPNDQVRQLGRTYCAAGTPVFYLEEAMPSLTGGERFAVDHAVGMLMSQPQALNYLIDRFYEVPVPDNCGAF